MREIPTYIVMQIQPEGPDIAPVGVADTLAEAEAIAHDPQWLHGGYTTRIYQMLAPTMAMSFSKTRAPHPFHGRAVNPAVLVPATS